MSINTLHTLLFCQFQLTNGQGNSGISLGIMKKFLFKPSCKKLEKDHAKDLEDKMKVLEIESKKKATSRATKAYRQVRILVV